MVILGIDAAWTHGEPSGVALVTNKSGDWTCVCVAPSYQAFTECASGKAVDWQSGTFKGTSPDIPALLKSAESLAGAKPDVVAIDMPVSCEAFSSRRNADQAISAAFGARGCATHSPTAERPGSLSSAILGALESCGFPLATVNEPPGTTPRVIEVYPHPAILALLACDYRLPYKVSKSTKYWPETSIEIRKGRLIEQLTLLQNGLGEVLGGITLQMPKATELKTLNQLKRYEDALDALACAWVGVRYIEGHATAFGDSDAAIWVPSR